MKQYETYKITNIPWLDKIPKHWKLIRNAIIFKEKKDIVGSNYKNYTLLSLTINGIIKRDIEGGKGKFPASFNTYKKVETNNIIFCLFDIDETPRTVGLSQHNGMITGAYNIFDIKQNNIYYIYYYYLSLDYFKQLKPLYSGLRKTIKINKFFSLETPIPPREEQDKIVVYLDYQISNINKLILGKKKQITLLEEYKKTKISEVVTKSLNPNVEMKDSGIDWIGQIPKHWEIKKLKEEFNFTKGLSITKENLCEKGYNVINYGQIHSKNNISIGINSELIKYIHENKINNNSKASLGDFIFADTSEDYNGCGNFIYIDKNIDLYAGYHTILLKSKHNKKNNFLAYIFLSALWKQQIINNVYGIKVFSITQKILKNSTILLPPLNEQKEIATYLDDLTFKLDNLISKHKLYIEKLEEYKKTLISNVVTGKIDVRDITIPEYEKVDITENTDENTDKLEME